MNYIPALKMSLEAYQDYGSDWKSELLPEESYKQFAIHNFIQSVLAMESLSGESVDSEWITELLNKAVRIVGLLREHDGAIGYLLMCFANDEGKQEVADHEFLITPEFIALGQPDTKNFHAWLDGRHNFLLEGRRTSEMAIASLRPYDDMFVTLEDADEFVQLTVRLHELVGPFQLENHLPTTNHENASQIRQRLDEYLSRCLFHGQQDATLQSAVGFIKSFNTQLNTQSKYSYFIQTYSDLYAGEDDSEFALY